jgi:hypothetical protein
MRATVFPIAVASLFVGNPVSALELAPAITFATPSSTQGDSIRVSSDTLRLGGRVIPAGDSVAGPVLVAAGDLRVRGTVSGTAVSLLGDVIVEEGGVITGDAIAILGNVRAPEAAIRGTARSFAGSFPWAAVEEEAPRARRGTADALSLSIGWLVVMLLIGIGVLIFAGEYLDGVSDVLERSFWRSFLVGLAAELALVPLLVLVCAALAVTVVGILLIPFAVVAYVLAVAGMVTLGFLAVAQLVGGGLGGRQPAAGRGRALRGLVLGVSLIMGAWVVAAAFQWWPIVSSLLRMLAFAVTFVAATAGLGAAVLSRGGTRRDIAAAEADTPEVEVWQTPTPVTGVVAARRPVRTS